MAFSPHLLCPKQTKILPKQTFFNNSLYLCTRNRDTETKTNNTKRVYKLKHLLTSVIGLSPDHVASDELFCSESNTRLAFLTNQMQETLAGYSYTLVNEGWLELLYNGRMLTLKKGDLLIYSPGVQARIIGGSVNYHSVCLMIDEQAALEIPAVRNVIHTAYQPIAELVGPSSISTSSRLPTSGSIHTRSSAICTPTTAICTRCCARCSPSLCST